MTSDTKRPYDPLVSVYPLTMSRDRARHEARRARRLRQRLPNGHPYQWLPLWVPFGLARLIMRSE